MSGKTLANSRSCGVRTVCCPLRRRVDSSVRQGRQHGQSVGVDQHRLVTRQHPAQQTDRRAVGAKSRSDHPGLHRARVGGRVDGHHLGPAGEHGRGLRAGVPHHPGPGADRTADTQHRRPRVAGRSGDDPDQAAAELVRGRPRPGQQLTQRPVGHGDQVGRLVRHLHPDRHADNGPGLRIGDQQARFDATEGHRDVGQERGAADLPAVRVDAAGQVDSDPQRIGRVRLSRPARPPTSRSGGFAANPTSPSMTTSACARTCFTALSACSSDPAAGPSERGQAGRCALAGSVRIAVTRIPRRRRNIPAYSASPPLLPEPTSSTACRPGCGDGTCSAVTAATA